MYLYSLQIGASVYKKLSGTAPIGRFYLKLDRNPSINKRIAVIM